MYELDNASLEVFFEPFYTDNFRRIASEITGVSEPECNEYLDGYINEARYALGRIREHLFPSCRVLEVGAGLGLLSLFLASRGFLVVANNVDENTFLSMGRLRQWVMSQYPDVTLPFVMGKIESLDCPLESKFDFLFSLNVLEHVQNVKAAFVAMSAMLKPSGCMWHSCPNYSFPYEPHLATLLLPFFPEKTAHFFPKLAKRKFGVWKTLNFITASELVRIADQLDLSLMFNQKVFYEHLLRLKTDPFFRGRHVFLYYVVRCLASMRVLTLFRSTPVWLATPMEFVVQKKGVLGGEFLCKDKLI